MKKMRLFIDLHDRSNDTFPNNLSKDDFEVFFANYEKTCYEEQVIPLRTHVSFEEGKAFCLNMAKDIEAIARVHARVGLPYDSISEVTTVTPGDMFFNRS